MSYPSVKADRYNMKGGEVMHCKDLEERLSLYLDAELEVDEATAIEAHLTTCADCRALLAEYRQDQQVLRSLPLVAPLPGWRAELLHKLDSSRSRSRRPTWRHYTARLGSLAAALLIVVLFSNLYLVPTHVLPRNTALRGREQIVLEGPDDAAPMLQGMGDALKEQHHNEQLEIEEPAEERRAGTPSDPSQEVAAQPESQEETMMVQATGLMAAELPLDPLQQRWWLWTIALSLLVWMAAAGYYYYRYRQSWQ